MSFLMKLNDEFRSKICRNNGLFGNATMSWFHSFKLRIYINNAVNLLRFCGAQANVNDLIDQHLNLILITKLIFIKVESEDVFDVKHFINTSKSIFTTCFRN